MKIKLTENILRKIIKESIKQAICETYSFNGYFDTKIDLLDCFDEYVENDDFYGEDLPVRVYYKYSPSCRGDYYVPDSPEEYEYKSCEPEQKLWQRLVELSGKDEEELFGILESYIYDNMDELVQKNVP